MEIDVKIKKQNMSCLQYAGNTFEFLEIKKSFDGIIRWYYKKTYQSVINYCSFLALAKNEIINILKSSQLPLNLI